MDLLLKMFHTGVTSLTLSKSVKTVQGQDDVIEPAVNDTHDCDTVQNLKCFLMMLDVLLKQASFA